MLLTITITIFSLVIFNFLLLKISCNKITKKPKQDRKPIILKAQPQSKLPIDAKEQRLAPTGS